MNKLQYTVNLPVQSATVTFHSKARAVQVLYTAQIVTVKLTVVLTLWITFK